MKYSMLAVHCTSFCFDIMLTEGFFSMNEDDIQSMYEDVHSIIYERLLSMPNTTDLIESIVIVVTQKILSLLWHLIRNPGLIDSGQILREIDETIRIKVNSEVLYYI
jgi:hypothetical protein|nr:hypothetical protein [uncultured Tolumonas sp.]